jgi:hypothetical protein
MNNILISQEKDSQEIKCNNNITGKSLLLLNSLLEYYSKNMNILTCIITQKNAISLRVLDWLVTNYSKKYNIVYKINKNNEEINFNIYLNYKNQLKAYSKKLFDPFCRRERILINTQTLEWKCIDNKDNIKNSNCLDNEILTTVGQLNFFKWFIENNILKYAVENIQEIDKDMIQTLNSNKDYKKRKELSSCATKLICSHEQKILVSFN